MLNLFDVMLLMTCAAVGMLFWQLRQISEGAELHARRLCNQRRLQMLSVARIKARIGKVPGSGLGWNSEYHIEFSTNGINTLTAVMLFSGKKLRDVKMPLYPEPEWQQAPDSKGRVSMGGCGGGGAKSCNTSSGCNTGCK
ncbi:DUF3301 domain-containing protein [Ferrimonas lipolytica]|uniref:DUF3301 domain-containing protein n=1 Tax=Ferrimonas lipolytica TaxID=2724191 RepID=A0A6H1UHY5_9GAMM|nr:DUF3301 domain-containing protein [Ferrimonas lipolytica]QIZ77402.1 DUF3301 domain-containing protein [Ferrimonas lipolytica]